MPNDLSATDVAILAAVFIAVKAYFDFSTARKHTTTAPPPAPQLVDDFATRLKTLETAVEGLPSLWATERARVKEQADLARRSAARIEQANRRAEEIRARGDEGADERPVAAPVHLGNGARGGEGQLRAVRADVAPIASGVSPHKMGR